MQRLEVRHCILNILTKSKLQYLSIQVSILTEAANWIEFDIQSVLMVAGTYEEQESIQCTTAAATSSSSIFIFIIIKSPVLSVSMWIC